MFCSKCGKEIHDEAVICVHCGCQTNRKSSQPKDKTYTTALLLCLFLGCYGAHRFYTGKTGTAIAQLLITILTLGFGVIITLPWMIIDLVSIICGNFKTADGEDLIK